MAGETSSDTTRLVVMLSFASIRSPPCSAKPDLSSSILNYSRPDIHISAPHYVSFFVVSARHLLARETFTPPYKFNSTHPLLCDIGILVSHVVSSLIRGTCGIKSIRRASVVEAESQSSLLLLSRPIKWQKAEIHPPKPTPSTLH